MLQALITGIAGLLIGMLLVPALFDRLLDYGELPVFKLCKGSKVKITVALSISYLGLTAILALGPSLCLRFLASTRPTCPVELGCRHCNLRGCTGYCLAGILVHGHSCGVSELDGQGSARSVQDGMGRPPAGDLFRQNYKRKARAVYIERAHNPGSIC